MAACCELCAVEHILVFSAVHRNFVTVTWRFLDRKICVLLSLKHTTDSILEVYLEVRTNVYQKAWMNISLASSHYCACVKAPDTVSAPQC